MTIVDTHCHVVAADHASHPLAPVPGRISQAAPARQELTAGSPGVPMRLLHSARAPLADGPPFVAAAPLFALAEHTNVYVKLTTHLYHEATHGRSTPRDLLARLVETFGATCIA